MEYQKIIYPKDIPIKEIPDEDGIYEVRTFDSGIILK